MKNYCVHVYEKYVHEGVLAATPAEAERKVVKQEHEGVYEGITDIRVLVQCGNCGYYNEPDAAKCYECGEPIAEVEDKPKPTNP